MPITQPNYDHHSIERSVNPRHKLLARQIRKYLKRYNQEDEAMEKFLAAVNESYAHYERDRNLLERSMDITFKELEESNARIRKEVESRKLALQNLRSALDSLHSEENLNLQPLQIDEKNLVELAAYLKKQIQERKRAESLLREQNETLRKINAELDKFVYSASHDLRAPLISVLGLVDLIKMEGVKGDGDRYLELVEQSIRKLDRFIKDIVDYSRNSRMGLQSGPIEFEQLLQEIFLNYGYIKGYERIDLNFEIEPGGDFHTDERRLRVVLSNLIGNGIQYATLDQKQPFVKVSVAFPEGKVLIKVEDNGRGIPETFLPQIFDMFFRAASDKPGSGLGLYIVKETVETLKGKISVESTEGKGTTFTVALPDLRNESH